MKLKNEYISKTKLNRLYELDIPIIALTGGIATGKSTVSNYLISKGFPLIDADKLVKKVYLKKEVQNYIRHNHPESFKDNSIDFKILRTLFFSDPTIKYNIEKLIYSHLPSVFQEQLLTFNNPSFVLYDIPLLFEKNLESKFDINVLVYTNEDLQIERLMKRDQLSRNESLNILSQQVSIEEKRKRADFIISNTQDLMFLNLEIDKIINQLFDL